MARTGENIRRRKDGRWEGRYRIEDHPGGRPRYRSVYARSYREVKDRLLEARNQQPSPEEPEESARPPADLGEILRRWEGRIQRTVKASTFTRYSGILRRHLVPDLGQLTLTELSPPLLSAYLSDKLEDGLSVSTVRDIGAVLRMGLRWAEAEGILSGISTLVQLPRAAGREIRSLTPEEWRRLERCCREGIQPHRMGVLLCLYTGMRLGEICGLRWEDVSLEAGTIAVRRTLQRLPDPQHPGQTTLHFDTPKTNRSRRLIPLPGPLRELLLPHRRDGNCFVLTGCGDRCMEPRTLQYHFRRILREAQVPEVNFHVLRHSFATRCVQQGFDPKSLSEILGHSSVSITLERYVHPSLEVKRQYMESLFAPAIRGQNLGQRRRKM